MRNLHCTATNYQHYSLAHFALIVCTYASMSAFSMSANEEPRTGRCDIANILGGSRL